MAFLIYQKTADSNGVRYQKVQPLKLGGRDGLLARHVRKMPDDEARSWKLDVPTLLELAGNAPAGAELTVLFDVSGKDATSVCLYELSWIHGSCRDTSTQLALDFTVVIDQEVGDQAAAFAADFQVTPPSRPKLLGETLSLSGGPGGGDWRWTVPPLQLGATVVSKNHGHTGGEPCANCGCGRRTTPT